MATMSDQNDTTQRASLYTPLEPTLSQVRFIEIIPSASDDQLVSCRLETMDLAGGTPYAALSYVWGDASITEDILVNGIKVAVTTNLASALRHFSKNGFPCHGHDGKVTWLWVDAICIDQSNMTEKEHQIPLMRELYANASLVFSWLGASDDRRLDDAIRTIRDVAGVVGELGEIWCLFPESLDRVVHVGFRWLISNLGTDIFNTAVNTGWEALRALGGDIYWSRAWIIQEIVLSQSPMTHWFICGNESALFADLLLFSWFIRSFARVTPPALCEYGARSTERMIWCHLSTNPLVYQLPALLIISRLTNHAEVLPGVEFSVFQAAIEIARCGSATLPHDYVYAALGMVKNSKVLPDYTKSVKEVYLGGAKLSVGTQPSLFLRNSGKILNSSNEYDLPSWLPNVANFLPRTLRGAFFDTRHSEIWTGRALLEMRTASQPVVVANDVLRIEGVVCSRVELIKDISPYLDNPKGLYHLCVDYILDFYGVEEAQKCFVLKWLALDVTRTGPTHLQQYIHEV
ncbi:heterokaryon incompatibility protein-domain-containing protein [Xylariaceae sp. FL1272]|nr:heterokaryon incompatibility protein-domain-containing protein [Xylariaceae sp. FL1272]